MKTLRPIFSHVFGKRLGAWRAYHNGHRTGHPAVWFRPGSSHHRLHKCGRRNILPPADLYNRGKRPDSDIEQPDTLHRIRAAAWDYLAVLFLYQIRQYKTSRRRLYTPGGDTQYKMRRDRFRDE